MHLGTDTQSFSHLLENFDHLLVILVVAVDTCEHKLAPSRILIALQTSRPQIRIFTPPDYGGHSITSRVPGPLRHAQGVFFDVVFGPRLRLPLTECYPAAFIIETTELCEQDADEKIHGRRVIGVDGSGPVKWEN